MSDFVFTLRVKPPKPSALFPGREMIVINSNVRIPDWVLTMLENSFKQFDIERLRQNHVIIFHMHGGIWQNHGNKVLEMLVDAPSNSRRFFPAEIVVIERFSGRVLARSEYPIWP